jgi:hypothetical protein
VSWLSCHEKGYSGGCPTVIQQIRSEIDCCILTSTGMKKTMQKTSTWNEPVDSVEEHAISQA